MKIQDIEYLCKNHSMLCGLPIRIYKKNNLIYYYSLIKIVKDPIILYINEILSKTEEIGYFATKDFYYYSYINYKELKIVIGPSRQIIPNDSLLSRIALDLDIKEDINDFITSMRNLTPLPLETVIQSLCSLNFILNHHKLTIKDIIINDNISKEFDYNVQNTILTKKIDEIPFEYANNSYAIEKDLYRIVEHGEIAELNKWIHSVPPIRSGILSTDALRQAKNIFIASITLTSRAAIKGMLDVNEALSLSDLYIQKMELLQNISDIMSLQMNMIIDYTERVAKIKGKNYASEFLISLNKYILSHLSEAIKVKDICNALYISKSSLFDKLKKETNMTLSNYILTMKINESKSLLKYTKKSISSISVYLGFSSQSHFNNVFKKITNQTPFEYRKTHK